MALTFGRPAPLATTFGVLDNKQAEPLLRSCALSPWSPVRADGAMSTNVRLPALHGGASVEGGVVGSGEDSLGMAVGLSSQGTRPMGLAPP